MTQTYTTGKGRYDKKHASQVKNVTTENMHHR